MSIYVELGGKIFDTDQSAVAATYIHWRLPGLGSRVAVTTALNFSSLALTLAHTVHSTFLSNISSLLKDRYENHELCVKILTFLRETMLNIDFTTIYGYASSE